MSDTQWAITVIGPAPVRGIEVWGEGLTYRGAEARVHIWMSHPRPGLPPELSEADAQLVEDMASELQCDDTGLAGRIRRILGVE